jgi:hypothetical protein
MNNNRKSHQLAMAISACLVAALSITQAVAQNLTMQPNADQTSMIVTWNPSLDDFSPRPTCEMLSPYIEVTIDGRQATTLHRYNALPSAGGSGCYQWKIDPAWTNKIQVGTWRANLTANGIYSSAATTQISACTLQQGKQFMFWTSYAPLTDNFYTTKVSDRDFAINLGHTNIGVPFSMPLPNGYDMRPFHRYYKGAPQHEHFYTHSDADRQFVEANGWVYEGTEGYIFTVAKPGTAPLYRYAYFNSANGDLMHLYTLDPSGPIGQPGWSADGVVGYVCP